MHDARCVKKALERKEEKRVNKSNINTEKAE